MTTSRTDEKVDSVLRRLFTGQSNYGFVSRSRTWAIVSAALMLVAVVGVLVRGVDFSIEFTGGTAFIVEEVAQDFDPDAMRTALGEHVDGDVIVDRLVDERDDQPDRVSAQVSTPAVEELGGDTERAVRQTLAEMTGVESADISAEGVGARWGQQVTERALWALVAFLVLVSGYIAIRFEWRMAAAALVTLLHDIVLTVGIYALVGFEVSPASVIALLTILGYSLYDTVVVFDRVSEDTATLGPTSNRTYGEFANDALNRVLLRSISTSATSLLPVGSLLLIGGQLLGADTLMDLALALFVGMAVGTYSSVFVATPLLVWLKERDPELAELKANILTRRGGEAAAAVAAAGGGGRGRRGSGRDRARKKPKKKRAPPSRGP